MKNLSVILVFVILSLFTAPAHAAIAIYGPSPDTSAHVAIPRIDGGDIKVVHKKKIGWFGIVALSSSVLGLIVGAIPFGIGGIVFGILGLAGKNKKLKGLALAGLILGAIDLIIGIVIVAALL